MHPQLPLNQQHNKLLQLVSNERVPYRDALAKYNVPFLVLLGPLRLSLNLISDSLSYASVFFR
jgi:hypothetical protein